MFTPKATEGVSDDAAPLLEPGGASSGGGSVPPPAAPAPRGKTRLANVSGFYPPKAESSALAAATRLWNVFWNSGLQCAAVSPGRARAGGGVQWAALEPADCRDVTRPKHSATNQAAYVIFSLSAFCVKLTHGGWRTQQGGWG
jgi:hypothetical protein